MRANANRYLVFLFNIFIKVNKEIKEVRKQLHVI